MILDIFSELQRAIPKDQVGDADFEGRVLRDAIEQAKLADELGFGCWWTVEHHGAKEFSYSSSPEMMLAVLSQHTERIHLGHSGVLAPFAINHPIRIAERAAFLDQVSGGRLELGLARSGGTEWETFEVDPDSSREQLREAMQMIPAMWTQDEFEWNSEFATIPKRNVVPKPIQSPHPPLWQTSTSPESFYMAGSMGVGVLGTTLVSPLSTLATLLSEYDRGLAEASPVGSFVNAQRSVFTFMHCAETREDAISSGAAEAILWFINAAPAVFHVPRNTWIDAIRGDLKDSAPSSDTALSAPEVYDDLDLNDPVPVIALLNRQLAGEQLDPVEVFEVMEAIESVIIGDPDACEKKLRGYADVGCDRLMCLMQMGGVSQESVLKSIRLTGELLIPRLL
ncbi:MAG: LLM class flavin-dependent oxidoreductase [Myxococcota bacterium]|jgi:alkanesulfonate monooxygenase SsuD/methylene tetrahydromethanopterin reductase-like flavin-dependent oxidoreductase (luciferase family)